MPVTQPTDPVDNGGSGFGGGNNGAGGIGDPTSGNAPVVPEPGSLLMMAVGSMMGGMAYLRRRRKDKAE